MDQVMSESRRCSLFLNNLTINDILYDLRASLTRLLTTNMWGYVPRRIRIRVQVKHRVKI